MKIDWKDKEIVLQLVRRSKSFADVLRNAGLSLAGANTTTANKWIRFHEIDTSHFESRYERARQHSLMRKRLPEEIFCKDSVVSQVILRREYRKLPDIPYACSCGNSGEWNGMSLTLQLDHINGANKDNRKENLRWLCPNCHSQTSTYAGKNCRTVVG